MRLIDADALPIKFDGHTVAVWKNDIDNAPTVDAVEVVRCKDCKWFYDCRKDGWGRCGEHDDYGRDSGWWQATDFCSWGERKEDGTD